MKKNNFKDIVILIIFSVIFLKISSVASQVFIPNDPKADSTYLKKQYKKGQCDAKKDIESDSLRYKFYGLPDYRDGKYAEILKERYNIIIDFVAGDIVSPGENAYWTGYNNISINEIERRYSKGILDSIYHEAKDYFPSLQPLNIEILEDVKYTEEALHDSIQGSVIIAFKILPSGLPAFIRVLKGLGYGLDEEAIRVVGSLRFLPAKYEEGEESPYLSITVKFKLKDN
jgi:TonB family protein